MRGGERRDTESEGIQTLHSLAQGSLGGPKDAEPGQRTLPAAGPAPQTPAPASSLGPTWCELDLDPRMEGHCGPPDPAGEVLCSRKRFRRWRTQHPGGDVERADVATRGHIFTGQ